MLVAVDRARPAPDMLVQQASWRRSAVLRSKRWRRLRSLIPLAAASFDLVVCRLAAHHFSDLPEAMTEMTRLARPGGQVRLSTWKVTKTLLSTRSTMPFAPPDLARQLVRQGDWHPVVFIAPPDRLRRFDLLAQVLQRRTRNRR